jgi:predicted Zn-dependent protease
MRSAWNAHYLDGKTAARRPATVELTPDGLSIRTEDGATFRWGFREIRQTQGSYRGEPVRLERGGDITEAIVIPDTAFLSELHRRAPAAGIRFHNPAYRRLRLHLTILAAVSAVGLSAAIYLLGIPLFASALTPFVPISWEEKMGDSAAEALAPPDKRCGKPDRLKPIQQIVSTLTAPLPRQPYRLRVIVVNEPGLNAFALPGGTIVVLRRLLEKTDTPEELAGVLAHELQHVLKRHTTRAVLQQASSAGLIAAVTGDASGAMAFGLNSARIVGELRYSRQNEEEADVEGMKMILEAGIDPAGMIRFYERLEKEGPGLPDALGFLSTHPATKDRIEELRAIARKSKTRPVPLLPRLDWKEYRKLCAPT